MPPFAGDRVRPGQHAFIHHDAAADPGAENDAEHNGRTGSGAIHRFRQGETIGIVGQPHRAAQCHLQIAVEGPADQPGRIGVLHQPGGRGDRARNADADRAAPAQPGFHAGHQIADCGDRRVIIAARCRDTLARQHHPGRPGVRMRSHLVPHLLQGDDLDFRAAQIDPDPHRRYSPPAVPAPIVRKA